jgi:hypothetical protein
MFNAERALSLLLALTVITGVAAYAQCQPPGPDQTGGPFDVIGGDSVVVPWQPEVYDPQGAIFRFTSTSPSILTVDPDHGTVPQGTTASYTVTINTRVVQKPTRVDVIGVLNGISDGCPSNLVTNHFNVLPVPPPPRPEPQARISVQAPGYVDFGYVALNQQATQQVVLWNTGDAGTTLSGSVSVTQPFTIISGGSFSISTDQTHTVVLGFTPTVQGLQQGTLYHYLECGESTLVHAKCLWPKQPDNRLAQYFHSL